MRQKLKWNEHQIEFLKKNYKDNGAKFCADNLGIPISKIHTKARKLGLKMTRKSRGFSTYVDMKQFFDITDPRIAYLLGFLWADGYITKYKVVLCIGKSDANVLKPVLDSLGKWYYQEYELERSSQPTVQMCMFYKEFTNFLLNLDYDKKTGICPDKVLKKIPKNLQHYWWRGYLEGDGNFCWVDDTKKDKVKSYFIQLVSSYAQDWKFLEEMCQQNNLSYRIKKTSRINKTSKNLNSESRFFIRNKQSVYSFLKYIYQDIQIGLPRKFKKWEELKSHIETHMHDNYKFKKIRLNKRICPL